VWQGVAPLKLEVRWGYLRVISDGKSRA